MVAWLKRHRVLTVIFSFALLVVVLLFALSPFVAVNFDSKLPVCSFALDKW